MSDRSPIGLLAQTACIWEATARKVGNVHPGADFTNTRYLDFVLSATAIGHILSDAPRRSVGELVSAGVRATRAVCASNTNLGIILLLAPLTSVNSTTIRDGLPNVLESLTVADARHVFAAIRAANPGGLGDAAEQNVQSEPTVTLLEAMKLAADRDQVARQYATNFADVFDFGVPRLLEAVGHHGCLEAAIIETQLHWLATFTDSLIARKCGSHIAADVQRRATEVVQLGGIRTSEGRQAGVALDWYLRSDGNKLNPGTTADLITACLFVALRDNKLTPSAPFRWQVPDWL